MKNRQVVKLFLVLIISTTFIFSLSHFGASAYHNMMTKSDQFAEGTMIGSLSVAGKTRNEALQLVDEQLTKWLNETTYTIKYKEKSELFDLSHFQFDIEHTVAQAKQGDVNPVHVELLNLEEFLASVSTAIPLSEVEGEELKGEILSQATRLIPGDFDIRLEAFLASGEDSAIIAEHTIPLEPGLELLEGETIEIGPLTQLSLLQYADEMGMLHSSPLSKAATAMYQVILPTNFSIIERHISSELPDYAELGFEAKVNHELKQDFVFFNPNDFAYLIDFKTQGDNLIVSLKGPELLGQYVIRADEKETFEPKTIRQFNPQLGPTEIKVTAEGKPGQLIKVYREHRDEQGTVKQKEFISEDFYPPIHQVEVQGLIPSEETIEEIVNGVLPDGVEPPLTEEQQEFSETPEEPLEEPQGEL